jgi:hypothetical protein
MRVSSNSKTLKQFQRNPWPFQTTFLTPLKDLERFVSTFTAAHQPIERGCVTIDGYIFEPKTLNAFLANQGISEQITHNVALREQEKGTGYFSKISVTISRRVAGRRFRLSAPHRSSHL